MAIRIEPTKNAKSNYERAKATVLKEAGEELSVLKRAASDRQKRKPSGKAKEAVTIRLTKDCVAYFKKAFGDDWRAEMQNALEKFTHQS